MKVSFSETAWKEYIEWQIDDKNTAKKINTLIKDIQTNGFMKGIGKPEALKGRKEYSRRIDDFHRLVYMGTELRDLEILSCKGHYEK